MEQLLAGIIGALLALFGQGVFRELDRQRVCKVTLSAICAEVATLCFIAKERDLAGYLRSILNNAQNNALKEKVWSIGASDSYFLVYRSLLPNLGMLPKGKVSRIVEFYQNAFSFLDICKFDFDIQDSDDLQFYQSEINAALRTLERALALGDEIARFVPTVTRNVSVPSARQKNGKA